MDAVGVDAAGNGQGRLLGDIDEVIDPLAYLRRPVVMGRDEAVGEDFKLGALVVLEQPGDQCADGVAAKVGREVADAQTRGLRVGGIVKGRVQGLRQTGMVAGLLGGQGAQPGRWQVKGQGTEQRQDRGLVLVQLLGDGRAQGG